MKMMPKNINSSRTVKVLELLLTEINTFVATSANPLRLLTNCILKVWGYA
jgi:hypothetical protein